MNAQPEMWPQYSTTTAERVGALLRSGAVFEYAGAGPIAELEELLRERYRTPYALTFNSGTSAIYAALAGAGVGPGDEVVVAGWTFLAAMTPLLWLGARPVLADVGPGEPVATAQTVAAVLTSRTRAVLVTHLFGEPVDTEALHTLLAPLGVVLIEDCSHAHATDVGGQVPGFWSDAAIFSLGARKVVSGGHGGALITRDRPLYETALMVGHSKPRTRREFAGTPFAPEAELALGGNLRMSPVAALLAIDHLSRLDELASARVENAHALRGFLTAALRPLRSRAPGANRTFFDLVWTVPDGSTRAQRDEVIETLKQAGVPAGPVSTRPLSRTLRAISRPPMEHSGQFWSRLDRWAADAPVLPEAERQHDLAISIRSELFWQAGAPYAHQLHDAISDAISTRDFDGRSHTSGA